MTIGWDQPRYGSTPCDCHLFDGYFEFISTSNLSIPLTALHYLNLPNYALSSPYQSTPSLHLILTSNSGQATSIKTMATILRGQGLRVKASRRFSPVSYREHGLPISENLLKQDFYASGPNQKCVGNITYLTPVKTGFIWQWLSTSGRGG